MITSNKFDVIEKENGYLLYFKLSDFLYTRYTLLNDDDETRFHMVDFEGIGYFQVGTPCLYDHSQMIVSIYLQKNKQNIVIETEKIKHDDEDDRTTN